jgi:hypothetical protein
MPNFYDLIKDKRVLSHPLLDGYRDMDNAREYLSRKGSAPDELTDMFSGGDPYKDERKDLKDMVYEASMQIQDVLNQFDLPMAPVVRFVGNKEMKYAHHDPEKIVSGTLTFDVEFKTIKGMRRHATIPVAVSSGEVMTPSIMEVEGRIEVVSQHIINQLLERAGSYELPPIRQSYELPLTKPEREMAVSIRNEQGWKESGGDPSNYMGRKQNRRVKRSDKGSIYGEMNEREQALLNYILKNRKEEAEEYLSQGSGYLYTLVDSQINAKDVDNVSVDHVTEELEKILSGKSAAFHEEAEDGADYASEEDKEMWDKANTGKFDLFGRPIKDAKKKRSGLNDWLQEKAMVLVDMWNSGDKEQAVSKAVEMSQDATQEAVYKKFMKHLSPEDKAEFESIKGSMSMDRAARKANMKTRKQASMPSAYELVTKDLEKAAKDGKDTFPRAFNHILRNYILEKVSTANKDQWMIPLINDGWCLNPHGVNVRSRKASQRRNSSTWDDLKVGDSVIITDKGKNSTPESYIGATGVVSDRDFGGIVVIELDYPISGNNIIEVFSSSVEKVEDRREASKSAFSSWKAFDRSAQEIEKEVDMEVSGKPKTYEDTKVPVEVDDQVEFHAGPKGEGKGNIVKIDEKSNTIIVKSMGKEYKVTVSDIEPMPETFKKMDSRKRAEDLEEGYESYTGKNLDKNQVEVYNRLTKEIEQYESAGKKAPESLLDQRHRYFTLISEASSRKIAQEDDEDERPFDVAPSDLAEAWKAMQDSPNKFVEEDDDRMSYLDESKYARKKAQEDDEEFEEEEKSKEVPDFLVKQMEEAAEAMRQEGYKVEINTNVGYVAVDLEGSPEESYFFQGDEAYDLLNEVPDNVGEEDYILWSARSW